MFTIIGLLGIIVYRYQPISAVEENIISFLKFPCALFTINYFEGFDIYKFKKLSNHLTLIATILSMLLIMNNIINVFGVESPEVFLVRGEKLLYSHARICHPFVHF